MAERPDDIVSLFQRPPAAPSQDARFRQGTIVSFDPVTLENQVNVGGTLLDNLPVLGIPDGSVLEPGARVGIIPVGGATKTMYIVGRVFTAGEPPENIVNAHSFCTFSSPVQVCLTDRKLRADNEPLPIFVHAADDSDEGYHTAGLWWAMPGDVEDDAPFSWDEDVQLHVLGGVTKPLWTTYEDGVSLPSFGRGYGLPDEDHGAPTGEVVAPTGLRWFHIGMRRNVGRDFDAIDNIFYGKSRLSFAMDEVSNTISMYVERPGVQSAGSGDYFPARNCAYFFQPEGLSVFGDVEAEQDSEVIPTLQLVSDAGEMHLGGRSIWAFEGGTPASITINNLVIEPDGSISSGGGGGGGGGWTVVEVTGTSQTMAADTWYIANNASLVTLTLPTTAAVGSVVRVIYKGAGGWKVAQNASEIIRHGPYATTTGTGGYIASSAAGDCVELVCIVADTEWRVVSSQGNLTVA